VRRWVTSVLPVSASTVTARMYSGMLSPRPGAGVVFATATVPAGVPDSPAPHQPWPQPLPKPRGTTFTVAEPVLPDRRPRAVMITLPGSQVWA